MALQTRDGNRYCGMGRRDCISLPYPRDAGHSAREDDISVVDAAMVTRRVWLWELSFVISRLTKLVGFSQDGKHIRRGFQAQTTADARPLPHCGQGVKQRLEIRQLRGM